MSHEEIAARDLVDRYVIGKLSAEESARFEAHFVDCTECLDQLETAERFRAALKNVAAVPAISGPARRPWIAWQVAAALVVALGASIFFAVRQSAAERELERARATAQEWQRRYQAARPPEPAPLVMSTFYLTIPRGADTQGSVPVNRVTVDAATRWVALSLEGEHDAVGIRVTVTDAEGRTVWQQSEARGSARTALSVVIPRQTLHAGDYSLTLETLSGGRYEVAGRYRFRVVER
jgi:methionine-rich copper-binding protein CopC